MVKEKNNYFLLIIVAIITLLIALAGATFAYLGAISKNNGEAKTIQITTGVLTLNFNDNNRIENIGAYNGQVIASKPFTIKGTVIGSNIINYEVYLNIDVNDYPLNSLQYIITSDNQGKNGKVIPSMTDSVFLNGIEKIKLGEGSFIGPIEDGLDHTYNLVITYIGEVEVYNNFSGYISVLPKIN